MISKLRISSLFLFFLIVVVSSYSQTNNTYWMDYLDELAENEELDMSSLEVLYEELSYLSDNPFNIQTIRKEDLERLPFMSPIQIENLLYYIYKYGPLVDIYELKNVEDLDMITVQYLLPFVYLGEPEKKSDRIEPKHLWKYAKQEALLRANFSLQRKAGYERVSEEEREAHPNKYYQGEPYYLSLRYNYNYRDRILFGLVGEKDPGEIFLNPKVKGFDHYAVNLSLKNFGKMEMLSLGDYRLSFGEGLVMNTNFTMGKTSDVAGINQKSRGITRHSSTAESQFFRGIATTLRFNDFRTSFFYSHKREDANVDGNRILSFKTDGYHRTFSDLQKRKATEVDLVGSHVQWQKQNVNIGLTAVYYSFGGKILDPLLRDYNRYYLRGKNHFNVGVNYSYRRKKILFQGEIAMDKSTKVATVNNISLNPLSYLDISLSLRYYSPKYNALYGKSFAESSTVQNEFGIYAGLKIRPFRYWEAMMYFDYFRFPYMKYGIDAPSSGNDFLVQLSYFPNTKFQTSVRYRYKKKAKNIKLPDDSESFVLPYNQHRLRFQLDYMPLPQLSLKTQVHYNIYKDIKDNQDSWSVSQMFSYVPNKDKFSLDLALAYFHSSYWNTRINIYEKNVLYAFSFPFYYGQGLRYYAVLKWEIIKPLILYFKAASTHYFDRTKVGSGPEEIEGREKSDIYILLKYKF